MRNGLSGPGWRLTGLSIHEANTRPRNVPFALSLIAREIADDYPHPNLTFLHDTSSYDFVVTAQGGLGDLLKKGRCTISDPVSLDYVVLPKEMSKDDVWRLQISVNCEIAGPSYFTRDGVIFYARRRHYFQKDESRFVAACVIFCPPHCEVSFRPLVRTGRSGGEKSV